MQTITNSEKNNLKNHANYEKEHHEGHKNREHSFENHEHHEDTKYMRVIKSHGKS